MEIKTIIQEYLEERQQENKLIKDMEKNVKIAIFNFIKDYDLIYEDISTFQDMVKMTEIKYRYLIRNKADLKKAYRILKRNELQKILGNDCTPSIPSYK